MTIDQWLLTIVVSRESWSRVKLEYSGNLIDDYWPVTIAIVVSREKSRVFLYLLFVQESDILDRNSLIWDILAIILSSK